MTPDAFKTTFGKTALHYAAENGQLEVLRLLIDNGTDVNTAKTIFGKTALHSAVCGGHLEVMRLLLDVVRM